MSNTGMPETPGVYADRDGDLWVFLWPFDTSITLAEDLYGIRFAYQPSHWSDDDPELKSEKQYQFFAPFTKLERLDTVDTDKEKTETKNMENTTPLTEDTASGGHAYPQGQVIIRCGECNSTIYRGTLDFVQLVKNWNKEAE